MPMASGLMTRREREICARLRLFRTETLKWSQPEVASILQISRDKLASLEYARTPLRFGFALSFCRQFDVNLRWLATGEPTQRLFMMLGEAVSVLESHKQRLFSEVYDSFLAQDAQASNALCLITYPDLAEESFKAWSKDRVDRILAVLNDLPVALAVGNVMRVLLRIESLEELQSIWRQVGALDNPLPARLFWNQVFCALQFPDLSSSIQKKAIDNSPLSEDSTPVKSGTTELERLLDQVRNLTKDRGMQSNLADFVPVSTSRVSEWLSGKCQPGGQHALRLQEWVRLHRGKQNSPAGAPTPARPRTRKKANQK